MRDHFHIISFTLKVETSWWAFLVAKRHAFDMFQVYTRVIARCLLQVFQSIQMVNTETRFFAAERILTFLPSACAGR